jgi:hypothetical protein
MRGSADMVPGADAFVHRYTHFTNGFSNGKRSHQRRQPAPPAAGRQLEERVEPRRSTINERGSVLKMVASGLKRPQGGGRKINRPVIGLGFAVAFCLSVLSLRFSSDYASHYTRLAQATTNIIGEDIYKSVSETIYNTVQNVREHEVVWIMSFPNSVSPFSSITAV